MIFSVDIIIRQLRLNDFIHQLRPIQPEYDSRYFFESSLRGRGVVLLFFQFESSHGPLGSLSLSLSL